MLDVHAHLLEQGGQPHRVTHMLCQTVRADSQARAGGEGMSGQLATEIHAYHLSIMDYTWVERQHADTKRHYQRCVAWKVQYAAASLRLGKDLQFVASLDGPSVRGVHDCMRRHKATCQLDPARSLRVKPTRMSGRTMRTNV